MRKKAFLLILTVFIVLSSCITQATDDDKTVIKAGVADLQDRLSKITAADIENRLKSFPDMKKHWSRQYVGKLAILGIISGTSDGTFRPDNPIKVNEFLKMAVCAMGIMPEQKTKSLLPYIDTAIRNGLVQKGEFSDYTKPITREQMAGIIVRLTLMVESSPGNKYDQYIIGKLKDYSTISASRRQSVIDAYKLGILTYSKDGKFRPKATLTRAESSIVILKLLDKKVRTPLKPRTNEIIKDLDSQGSWQEMYPGPVREYFDVAKAMQNAIPKAKGFVSFGFNTSTGRVFASLYKDEKAYNENIVNVVAGWAISPETPDNANNPYTSVYLLTVYDDDLYKSLFADYSHEVIKAIFGNDSVKAIALHDKYMNMRNNTLNRVWEETKLNTRKTGAFRDNVGFSFSASILGKK